jgi:hypothetical protein
MGVYGCVWVCMVVYVIGVSRVSGTYVAYCVCARGRVRLCLCVKVVYVIGVSSG